MINKFIQKMIQLFAIVRKRLAVFKSPRITEEIWAASTTDEHESVEMIEMFIETIKTQWKVFDENVHEVFELLSEVSGKSTTEINEEFVKAHDSKNDRWALEKFYLNFHKQLLVALNRAENCNESV